MIHLPDEEIPRKKILIQPAAGSYDGAGGGGGFRAAFTTCNSL
jgi:hypothetical protein